MPANKGLASNANDAAFTSSFQDLFKIFQNRLVTAKDDAEKQAATAAATNGLTMLKNVHDQLDAIINIVFK